jgi:sec-independent protein translocase protein TatB
MLPDVGATEYLVIAIVALIVVGPKDLPVLLRKLGQFLAKLRGMASEFRASFDEMARQSELDDLRKEVEAMRSGQLTDMAAKASGIESDAAFDEINQGLTDVGVQLHPPMSYQYDAAATAAEVQPIAKPPRKPRAKAGAAKTPAKAAAARASAPRTAAASKKAAPPRKAAPPKRTVAPKAAAKAKPAKAPANRRRSTVEPG